jgi:GntR family transcriptional regulator
MSWHPEPELILQGGSPIHFQIEEQIRACIHMGDLQPGDQLPTVRTVAVELAVSPGVVGRAYDDLEREGLLTSEDGSGTFVAAPPQSGRERQAELKRLCAEFLALAGRHGYSAGEVATIFQCLAQKRTSP